MLGSQMIQMGCLLPGRDSVGRQYPVCLQLSLFEPARMVDPPAEHGGRAGTSSSAIPCCTRCATASPPNRSTARCRQSRRCPAHRRKRIPRYCRLSVFSIRTCRVWAGHRPPSVSIRCVSRPATGGPTAATVTRSTPTCTAATSPGSCFHPAVRAQRLGTPRPRRPVPANV